MWFINAFTFSINVKYVAVKFKRSNVESRSFACVDFEANKANGNSLFMDLVK